MPNLAEVMIKVLTKALIRVLIMQNLVLKIMIM